MINNTFRCNDKIAAWKYTTGSRYNSSDIGYASVWRPLDNSYKQLQLVHKTKLCNRIYYTQSTITLSHSFHVQEGDVIGFHTNNGSLGPVTSGRTSAYDGTHYFEAYSYKIHDENLPLGTIVDQVAVKYKRFSLWAIMDRPGKIGIELPMYR